ncbi:MAG: site-specific DNA-methyltransferase [Leptospiraceae bacterium]|nr:site-specific DNA-methyltransferase [Leptospiraceae bacterium]
MEKLKMQTPNIVDEHIENIGNMFPNVITEIRDEKGNLKKAIDFDLLKQQLSDVIVEDDNERYRLDWPGKKASLLKANTPINKTLRPVVEESVDFDTTENLYIEGDNFEVLKILQESYLGKVKMIYIDPPYNTGKDFIYKDNFKITKDEYDEELGVENEEGEKLFKNSDTNGRFHSDWLSMMYERLVVGRDLLKDDGVILISIDDNEVHNLRKICDEIFGEENFFASLVRKSMHTVRNSSKDFNKNTDFVLVYGKNKSWFESDKKNYIRELKDKSEHYNLDDNDGRGKYKLDPLSARNYYKPYKHTFNNGVVWKAPEGSFPRYSEETLDFMEANNRIVFSGKEPRAKRYLNEVQEGQPPDTLLKSEDVGYNFNGTKTLANILNSDKIFSQPKPIELIEYFIKIIRVPSAIILDFFSGSATTAHAVMQLNAEDGGERKFIMVQLPEKTDENSEAYKAGYKTISDIGKERIRRAGKNILDELNEKNKQLQLGDNNEEKKLDIGFRVYKVDSSNMKDVYYHPTELNQDNLLNLESNIKEDRTPEDLLTQVILDLGLELNLPIEKKKINKNNVFFVQENSLVACFEDKIDFSIIDEIAKIKPLKVVFKDASFKDDKDRINVEERFKRLSPETSIMVL